MLKIQLYQYFFKIIIIIKKNYKERKSSRKPNMKACLTLTLHFVRDLVHLFNYKYEQIKKKFKYLKILFLQ